MNKNSKDDRQTDGKHEHKLESVLSLDSQKLTGCGRAVLEVEAQAVSKLAERLDHNFAQAVLAILDMSAHGRVIVSGMGKAGFIGMKISATLASIGVPSFFLNPAEASHGDLGRYTKQDLALVLSNSGETDEVLKIIPHIKHIGCPLIAMTGAPASTLARYSDVVLDIGAVDEAGPLGLAPTTSTILMLALGDALAMALLEKRGLSREEFAFLHPGGNLGRSLTPVAEIMRQGQEHCTVPENITVRELLQRITATRGRPGAASVVDSRGKLVGAFTDGDLRRGLAEHSAFLEMTVGTVMGRSPKKIHENQTAAEALKVLSDNKIDQVIVVNAENSPVGMVDIQDLIEVRLLNPMRAAPNAIETADA